ncbi:MULTISPECIES: hypothetical protein [unclassified Actinomyces]|uniref:hypothetical protein n=1 Tax=unclassified Actinomyces TaxID=2609248 RepID=UPI0013A6D81D|nr:MULTISPECIES: hypothetical protein [unclassified Actinomyces]MBW3069782.1 hypothetical protein [Actinomyces sp. 594]NDR54108.1 hypothetical protein [Actinomyces sp. 565]
MQFTADRSDGDLAGRRDLIRVARGGYMTVPGSDTPTWRLKQLVTLARCEAALRVSPSAIALTHEAAAVVLGLPILESEPNVRLAVPGNRSRSTLVLPTVMYGPPEGRRRGRSVKLLRSTTAPLPEEVINVGGLRVTTPLRTAMDCAFDLPVRESLPVVDAALRVVCRPDRFNRRCYGEMEVDAARERLMRMVEGQGQRHGKRRARVAVERADPFAESPGESVLRWAVDVAGVPEPVTQRRWIGDDAREYFLDVAVDSAMVDLEFDGYGKLATSADVRAEKQREMVLRRGGWTVHRFEWRELADPERLVRRVESLFPPESARGVRRRRDLWL